MRIGIVGGGITGLALTHALAREGVDSVLLERAPVAGGVVRTRVLDGEIFEAGPQRTRLVPSVRRLVGELELGNRLIEATPGARLYIWARGGLRAVPAAPTALFSADLLTPGGRARLAFEPLTAGLRRNESVATYFARKAGDEAYRSLFGPLVSATFASDPGHMPARHSLPMILGALGVRRSLLAAAARWKAASYPACTFAGGMVELVSTLAERHADRIGLSREVRAVERDGGRHLLRCADGSSETVDRVVITAPAPVAADLLCGHDQADGVRSLAALRYNEVSIVSLRARPNDGGFGFQTAFGSRWRTRGVTWAGWLFGRGNSCTAYLGGGVDPEIADWPDERIMSQAEGEFEEIHGRPAEAVAVDRARLPAYDSTWDGLDGLSLPQGITLAANYRGRLGVSARIAQAESLAESFAAES